jgi:lactate permease
MAAVVMCLVFNSFPVSFGGAGIPILTGIGPALKTITLPFIAPDGGTVAGIAAGHFFSSYDQMLQVFTAATAWGHLPMIFIIAIFMEGFMTKVWGPNHKWGEGFAVAPFCILSSFCFAVPYMIFSQFVGCEPASLCSALIGLAITIPCAKKGICMPKGEAWTFGPQDKWAKEWVGTIPAGNADFKPTMSQFRAWTPYGLIGLILVITRLPMLPFKHWFAVYGVLRFNHMFGFEKVNQSLALLNLPGIIPFLLVALICMPLHHMNGQKVAAAWKAMGKSVYPAAIALCSSVALVSIYQHSGWNPAGNPITIQGLGGNMVSPTMPMTIATFVASITGGVYPYFAYFVGALGAFITGSNTVSNLLFGEFQWGMATQLHMSHVVMIAAQIVGGAGGNMICINNVVAAEAVTGMLNREGEIIKKTIIPCVLYGIVCAIVVGIMLAVGYRAGM